MKYRQTLETTADLAEWYEKKYLEMGGSWVTPPEDCERHLDALGVPFDRSKLLMDIGCGGGHFLEQAEKRVMCVGIDVCEEAVRLTQGRAKRSLVWQVGIDRAHTYLPFKGLDWNYIVSIGSLEHVIDIDRALDNIHSLLKKPDGRWYFYCPNELWVHEDQPNERTATDEEWIFLFSLHGLKTEKHERWGDNTAFQGVAE